jgi:uncharacterized protein (TIGR02444 family)
MDFPEHPFWDFALKVYQMPGVSEACLEIQERHGADVNVVLFCCWLGESGRGAVTPEKLAEACKAVASWNETVVKRLRAVRRVLKEGIEKAPSDLASSLRKQIQTYEIDAEHIELLTLAASVADMKPDPSRPADARADDAIANIGLYLVSLNATLIGADRTALGRIVGAAFPAYGAQRAETQLSLCMPITF